MDIYIYMIVDCPTSKTDNLGIHVYCFEEDEKEEKEELFYSFFRRMKAS